MKDFNATTLLVNMPVNYIAENDTSILVGHFARYDNDGAPYVWAEGGTSYNRHFRTIGNNPFNHTGNMVKCKMIAPLTSTCQATHRHKRATEEHNEWLKEFNNRTSTDNLNDSPAITYMSTQLLLNKHTTEILPILNAMGDMYKECSTYLSKEQMKDNDLGTYMEQARDRVIYIEGEVVKLTNGSYGVVTDVIFNNHLDASLGQRLSYNVDIIIPGKDECEFDNVVSSEDRYLWRMVDKTILTKEDITEIINIFTKIDRAALNLDKDKSFYYYNQAMYRGFK